MAVLVVSNSVRLSQLKRELQLIDQRQKQKFLERLDRTLQKVEQSESPGEIDAGMVDVNMKTQNEGPHRHPRYSSGPCIRL